MARVRVVIEVVIKIEIIGAIEKGGDRLEIDEETTCASVSKNTSTSPCDLSAVVLVNANLFARIIIEGEIVEILDESPSLWVKAIIYMLMFIKNIIRIDGDPVIDTGCTRIRSGE